MIDGRRSSLEIDASSTVHAIHIRSRSLEGNISFADGVGSGRLVIPVKSLHGDTPLHDLELRRRIPPRRYPTIEATVRKLTIDSAEGDIAFFGTTKAASGPLSVSEGDAELVITGETTFDVRDFGFDPPNILGMKVHSEITVRVDLVAVKQ
jgi:hypothetical protein